MTTSTYHLYDDSLTIKGTPKQITHALWRNCQQRCHSPLPSVKAYMEWQRRVEGEWSGKTLDTGSYEAFVASLVTAGFLVPIK